MVGSHGVVVMADAVLKRIPGVQPFDVYKTALDAITKQDGMALLDCPRSWSSMYAPQITKGI